MIEKLINLKKIESDCVETFYQEYEDMKSSSAASDTSEVKELVIKVKSQKICLTDDDKKNITFDDVFKNMIDAGNMFTGPESVFLDNINLNFLDEDLSKEERISKVRRIYTRLLAASNVIAVYCRRGPANGIIMPRKLAAYILEVDGIELDNSIVELAEAFKISGMQVYYSDNQLLNDKIIVYRKSPDLTESNSLLLIHKDKQKIINIGDNWYKNIAVLNISN